MCETVEFRPWAYETFGFGPRARVIGIRSLCVCETVGLGRQMCETFELEPWACETVGLGLQACDTVGLGP